MSFKKLFIGGVEISPPTILAPMEAVNCEAFMKTCAHFSCGLVSTQAIENIDDNFYDLNELKKIPSPVSFQIMTNKVDEALALVKQVEPFVDIIDFNFGCPLKKTLGEKKGGYLLQFPHLIKKLVKPVVDSTNLPVTIKIRLGFDENRETFLEIGKIAEEIGVSAISLHARYVKESYRGKARWDKIKELKNTVSIPVIANGDITKPGHVKMLLEKNYCDGVMIGREAKKNPVFFEDVKKVLGGESLDSKNKISSKEVFSIFYSYYKKQSKQNLHQVQDHASWFVRYNKNATLLKKEIRNTKTFSDLESFMKEIN